MASSSSSQKTKASTRRYRKKEQDSKSPSSPTPPQAPTQCPLCISAGLIGCMIKRDFIFSSNNRFATNPPLLKAGTLAQFTSVLGSEQKANHLLYHIKKYMMPRWDDVGVMYCITEKDVEKLKHYFRLNSKDQKPKLPISLLAPVIDTRNSTAAERRTIWNSYFGSRAEVWCPCCEGSPYPNMLRHPDVRSVGFALGHIQARSEFGVTEQWNLVPICAACNSNGSDGMGTKNMLIWTAEAHPKNLARLVYLIYKASEDHWTESFLLTPQDVQKRLTDS